MVRVKCAKHNAISMNLLDLMGMAMTACGMVEREPDPVGAPVVMLGDNVSAVAWVETCGGTRDPRVAFLIRYLGRIQMPAGSCAILFRGHK